MGLSQVGGPGPDELQQPSLLTLALRDYCFQAGSSGPTRMGNSPVLGRSSQQEMLTVAAAGTAAE